MVHQNPRQARIRELIARNGECSVEELAKRDETMSALGERFDGVTDQVKEMQTKWDAERAEFDQEKLPVCI